MISPNLPFEFFFLDIENFEGGIVARVGERSIREVAVDKQGCRYRYVGVASRDICGRIDVVSLRRGEWLVSPNFIYERTVQAG